MHINQLILEVSRDLNDQVPGSEYLRWPYEQLLSYYEEVLLELAEAAKWLFTRTVVVPLEPCTTWQYTCDCTHIYRVYGECTKDGDLLNVAQETSDDDIYLWPNGEFSNRCDTINRTRSTKFTSYKINRVSDDQFSVSPPVSPTDSPRYALVECYGKPNSSDESFSIPDEFIKPIKQWMLYRALIIDAENNDAIREIAKTHLQVYQSCLAAFIAKEKELEEKRNGNNSARTVQNGASQPVQTRT